MFEGKVDSHGKRSRTHYEIVDLHREASVRVWIGVHDKSAYIADYFDRTATCECKRVGPCSVPPAELDIHEGKYKKE